MDEVYNSNVMLAQCITFLSEKSILVQKTEPPYVFFDYNILNRNLHCVFAVGEGNDPNYCRFIIPNLEAVQGDNNINDVVGQITAEHKAGKAFMVGGKVWLSVECFVYSTENIKSLYDRMFSVLVKICQKYLHYN